MCERFIICPMCLGTGLFDQPSLDLTTGRFTAGTAHASCWRCNGKGVIGVIGVWRQVIGVTK